MHRSIPGIHSPFNPQMDWWIERREDVQRHFRRGEPKMTSPRTTSDQLSIVVLSKEVPHDDLRRSTIGHLKPNKERSTAVQLAHLQTVHLVCEMPFSYESVFFDILVLSMLSFHSSFHKFLHLFQNYEISKFIDL